MPARRSSSIARDDDGHDNGPASGQGRRGLPDRGADRARRHGPGLPGRAPEPGAPRRDQADRARPGRGGGLPRALQPRGADRRRAPAPEHRHGLRRRRGGRPALPRDAAHRGLGPRRVPPQPGPAAPVPGARRLPPGRRRARRRPRAGPDPPRRQARQRADRGPHGVPHRLRPDQAGRRLAHPAHARGRRGGHDPLRRARADRGRPGRRAQRHLLARLPRSTTALGRAAVRARHRRGRDLRAPVRGAAAAHLGAPGPARRARRGDRQGAREGAGAALPDLRGPHLGRPLGDRRRRPAVRHRHAAAGAGVRRATDVPTSTGARRVPATGDHSSVATGIGPVGGHVEAARRPRVLLAGVDGNTRALTRVAVGPRIDVEDAAVGPVAAGERARRAPGPRDPRLERARPARARGRGRVARRRGDARREGAPARRPQARGRRRRRGRGRRRPPGRPVLPVAAAGQAAPACWAPTPSRASLGPCGSRCSPARTPVASSRSPSRSCWGACRAPVSSSAIPAPRAATRR